MQTMHINDIDLNLLRVFDAVYRLRSVSRAADAVGLTQPAASHALTRLRLLVRDALFVRAPGGVQPTPRADELAPVVRDALAQLERVLTATQVFDPAQSRRTLRFHMSDIGEGSFLPPLIAELARVAPGMRLETFQLDPGQIADALDAGRLDLAMGFLPTVTGTRSQPLFDDRYVVVLRAGHPLARGTVSGRAAPRLMARLEYVVVRGHSESTRILALLRLEHRIRLVTEHFLVTPALVRTSDLAVLMPRNIARGFAAQGDFAILEPRLPHQDFVVSMHWSARAEADPVSRWLRELMGTTWRTAPEFAP